jgi:hypothetical protein
MCRQESGWFRSSPRRDRQFRLAAAQARQSSRALPFDERLQNLAGVALCHMASGVAIFSVGIKSD